MEKQSLHTEIQRSRGGVCGGGGVTRWVGISASEQTDQRSMLICSKVGARDAITWIDSQLWKKYELNRVVLKEREDSERERAREKEKEIKRVRWREREEEKRVHTCYIYKHTTWIHRIRQAGKDSFQAHQT